MDGLQGDAGIVTVLQVYLKSGCSLSCLVLGYFPNWIPTDAEAALQRAEAALQRAESERQRAEQAERRAEELAQRLRDLGIEP